jgi:hypothetical protein
VASRVDDVTRAADESYRPIRIGIEDGRLLRETVRVEDVVSTEHLHVAAASLLDRPVPIMAWANVDGILDESHTVIADRSDDRDCAIGRCVIDDDDLKVVIALVQHGVDRRGDIRFTVADGDAYRYGRQS